MQRKPVPDIKIENSGRMEILNKMQYEISVNDIAQRYPIEHRISNAKLNELLKRELTEYGVNTPFEFGIYSNGLATKIRSSCFCR